MSDKIKTAKGALDANLAKAKQGAANIKIAARAAGDKTAGLRRVPDYSKYGVNASFTELVNIATGKVQQIPVGKKKYLIFNDKNERRSIGMDDIKALLPAAAPKPKKPSAEKKVAGNKKYSLIDVAVPAELGDLSINEILSSDFNKNKKAFLLHLAKQSNEKISQQLNRPIPSIVRDIWKFKTGQTALK